MTHAHISLGVVVFAIAASVALIWLVAWFIKSILDGRRAERMAKYRMEHNAQVEFEDQMENHRPTRSWESGRPFFGYNAPAGAANINTSVPASSTTVINTGTGGSGLGGGGLVEGMLIGDMMGHMDRGYAQPIYEAPMATGWTDSGIDIDTTSDTSVSIGSSSSGIDFSF